jgi:hypothetical protein
MRSTVRTDRSVCRADSRSESPQHRDGAFGDDNRHHHGKPYLARRLRAAFVVHEPGKMVGLEARDPPAHGRARDPEKSAETHLVPALIIELHHLQGSVGTIGLGVIVPPCRLLGSGHGTLVPQLLDRVVMDGVAEREE